MSLRGRLYCFGALTKGLEWQRYLEEATASVAARTWPDLLEETIRHAVSNVPYYASLSLPTTPKLSDFPILTRRMLRDNLKRLHGLGTKKRTVSRTCTGGSTGEPIWMIHDRRSRQWDYAAEMYFLGCLLDIPIPIYLSHPRVAIWHTRDQRRKWLSITDWVARLLNQVTFIEPYAISSEETFLSRLAMINRIRPLVIWGFASSLHELARVARRKNIRLHSPQVIISSVETLYPEMRRAIEEAFGCPVRDCYGAVEVRRVAAECSQGRLHLLGFNCHVEILDSEGVPAKPSEEGRLVVTPLHNRAMPLLRYDIGDMASMAVEPCPCGNPLPVLDGIRGRVIEHFVRTDGSLVYGGFFVAMFYEHDWISEFQVLQQDVEDIAVYFKTMPEREVPSQAFAQLEAAIHDVMGSSCRIEWNEVAAVPRTPLGKHLHTRSLVWEERQRHDP
ncbi:phenylacetate--CoA ligase family protein [Candidatus Bipolaricaulota bacterium]